MVDAGAEHYLKTKAISFSQRRKLIVHTQKILCITLDAYLFSKSYSIFGKLIQSTRS